MTEKNLPRAANPEKWFENQNKITYFWLKD